MANLTETWANFIARHRARCERHPQAYDPACADCQACNGVKTTGKDILLYWNPARHLGEIPQSDLIDG